MRERLQAAVRWLVQAPLARRLAVGALLLIVAATVIAAVARDRGSKSAYVLQAEAFLRGALDVPDEGLVDLADFGGRVYVPLPPFPAVVLMPFVALFGRRIPPTVVGILLALLSLALLERLLRRTGVETRERAWIAAGFFLGTGYWWSLLKTWEMWSFAQLVGVAMALLAMHEAVIARRAWTAGLAFGAALLSRQFLVFAAPFLLAALWRDVGGGRRIARTVVFLAAGGALFGVYLAFNWARFGSPFDTGYAYIRHMGYLADRAREYGLFHVVYLPHNLVSMFLQGFHVEFMGPMKLAPKEMDPFGTSLTVASPFLVTAFLARGGADYVRSAWLSILPMLAGALLYYSNGWVQVNCQRYTLDFMPFLIWLQALGTKHVDGRLWKAGIAWAVGLNLLAIVGVRIASALLARLGLP